ncbi:hypothetical protein QWZ06_07350 [Chryseobacterium tructae]|uniref:Uncharacterized protein n=1 Tax=Chryseobacterium tructae TaxID=1037380 RepID=A0ABV7XTR1_9FLAO|nr:hypothetical protein [Chryseobacterium tructae]MDN3692085.1 hypothetical protein [Chryseobacterium tructae]
MDPTKKQGKNKTNNPNKAQPILNPKLKSKALIQPGYATGDMFAIAAALVDDDELHVIITKGNENCNDPTDKADSIKKFYEESGIAKKRIHVVEVSKLRSNNQELKEAICKLREQEEIPKKEVPLGYGTDYVAENFTAEMQEKLRDAWKVNSNERENDAIKKWLIEKGIPTRGDRLLILWSRFSGKNGDIHIEHDTSYFGIKQIVNRAVDMYDAIMITGDKGYQKERRDKGWRKKDDSKKRGHQFDEIAEEINAEVGTAKIFNITEFWNDEASNELPKWDGDTRMGQFKLYEYFEKNFDEVKHLGFRSGNLEVMAMLGYTVLYMEEYGSIGGERMAKWNDNRGKILKEKGIIKATKDIGYQRILLNVLPTRTGKYLQDKKAKIVKEVTERIEEMNEEEKNELVRKYKIKNKRNKIRKEETEEETLKRIIKEEIDREVYKGIKKEKIDRPDFTPGKEGRGKKPDEIRDKYQGFDDADLDNLFNRYIHVGWEGPSRKEDKIKWEIKKYSEPREDRIKERP